MNDELYNKIVNDEKFLREKEFFQHGKITTYDHSINVCQTSLKLIDKLHIKVERDSLIKGCLLHDYYLYDWHTNDKSHRLHGIHHPLFARNNAMNDFGLNKKEENMILSHMFPLRFNIPKYKESIILTLVDKYCAIKETFQKK